MALKILESKRVKFVSAMKELLKSDEYYQVFKKMKTGTENMTRDEMLLFCQLPHPICDGGTG